MPNEDLNRIRAAVNRAQSNRSYAHVSSNPLVTVLMALSAVLGVIFLLVATVIISWMVRKHSVSRFGIFITSDALYYSERLLPISVGVGLLVYLTRRRGLYGSAALSLYLGIVAVLRYPYRHVGSVSWVSLSQLYSARRVLDSVLLAVIPSILGVSLVQWPIRNRR